MVGRGPNESREHRDLVLMMANFFTKEGYLDVKADLINWNQPQVINGHIPDVTGIRNGELVILEAESCDTINDSHTADQWKAFSQGGKFHVVVPKRCRTDANNRLTQLGLIATVWTPQ